MLTSRYLFSTKNFPAIMQRIVEGAPPETFSLSHLQGLGFKASGDRSVIPLLKELGFLTPEGKPTQRYHEYRDKSKSKKVMADAIREAYEELFHINEDPNKAPKEAIVGKFKTATESGDAVAEKQYLTFKALLQLADLNAPTAQRTETKPAEELQKQADREEHEEEQPKGRRRVIPREDIEGSPFMNLRYNIEIHLPATKDVEVYNAIFKSLKEHLID